MSQKMKRIILAVVMMFTMSTASMCSTDNGSNNTNNTPPDAVKILTAIDSEVKSNAGSCMLEKLGSGHCE